MVRLGLCLVMFALPAGAWPADWLHDVPDGGERFVKLPHVDWLEVDDGQVLEAEWLAGSQELLLSGRRPGRALVLLAAQGKVALWRVRVGGAPLGDEKKFSAAAKACKDFRPLLEGPVKLTVTIATEACRLAMWELFQTDAFEGKDIEVTFERPQLQAQLKRLQEVVTQAKLPAVLRYAGAGLVLEGSLTQRQHRDVLWLLMRHIVGRLIIDDQVVEKVTP
jgi:hypothetical protein